MAKAKRLQYENLKDLFEQIELDEREAYLCKTRDDVPLQNLIFMGVSFERVRGKYDRDLKTMLLEPGVVQHISPRLAEEIRERAEEVFYRISYFYDKLGTRHPAKVLARVDTRKPSQKAFMNRSRFTYDQEGRVKTAWVPVKDIIIMRKIEGASVTSEEALRAELEDVRRQLARAQQSEAVTSE